MSILITGSTGFIGAEVVHQLLAQGETEINAIHRSSNFQRLHGVIDQVNFIQVDLGDRDQIFNAVQATQPKVIYHLGAILTGPGEANPQAAIQTNALGTYAILEAARLFDVRQVLYSSSIGVYGADIREDVISDFTLQRPFSVYGITKIFGEQLGSYYKRKYGLDFRGLRYPSIIGPGVKTPSVLQYTSWIIEQCAKGNPFTVTVTPKTAAPVMYYKDAARAIIQLGQALLENIRTITYLVDGPKPTPTAGQLADTVRQKIPGAQINFEPNPQLQPFIDQLLHPLDDSRAKVEWNWQPSFDLKAIVDDFLDELAQHPERYR